ncbi:hypothetical protein HAX54_024245 [Datura stramonium]|uniref:DUF4283 domain-containing protein n=1 Tax=Datura stramonium TaxID=4076 RepID=A0ABS8UZQ7_DATST|nr:hypothetical protein [Datura stramonium]
MTDEIAERLKKFILTEEEKGSVEIAVQDIMSSMEHCEVSFLGKVIVDKQVNVIGVRNTMNLIWGNPAGLKVLLVDKNLFQIILRHKDDMKKVMYGIPWLYDKILGHTERSYVIREDNMRQGAIKRDQFGAWMRANNHDFAGINARRQGNTDIQPPVFTNDEGKKIMDCAEGTGSNELLYNEDGIEVLRHTGSKEDQPSFTPHEFFKKLKEGGHAKNDSWGGHNTTTATQRHASMNKNELEHITNAALRSYEGRAEARKGKNNNMIPKVDNMLVDKTVEANELVNRSLKQIPAGDEPMFADTIRGREAREYYFLSKMDLGDTFDQDDIDKYYKNNMKADFEQARQKIIVQMAQLRMTDMKNSQQQETIRLHSPSMVFLSETKNRERMILGV